MLDSLSVGKLCGSLVIIRLSPLVVLTLQVDYILHALYCGSPARDMFAVSVLGCHCLYSFVFHKCRSLLFVHVLGQSVINATV